MQRRSGPTPPKPKKKTSPPRPMTGAFAAPAVSTILGQPDNPVFDTGVSNRTAQAEAKALKAARAAAVARNKAIVAKRKDEAFRANVAADVSAAAGLAPVGSLGQVGVAKPSHTFTPVLTPAARLAASRQRMLTHGGLPDPARAAQTARDRLVVSSQPTRFIDTHALPSELVWGTPASHAAPPETPTPPPKPPGLGYTKGQGPSKGHGFAARLLEQPLLGRYAKPLRDAASYGLGTGVSVLESVPREFITPIRPGASTPVESVKPTTLPAALQDIAVRTNDVASGVGSIGLHLPANYPGVPSTGINWPSLHGGVHDPAAEAASTVSSETASKYGFTPEYTANLRKQALAQGWYPGEIDQLNGMDLLLHSVNKPPNFFQRVAQNFASGAVRTGAAASGIAALTTEIAHGHGMRALDQFAGQAGEQGLGWLKHPLESAVTNPYALTPGVGLAGKTLGMAGHIIHYGKDMPLREIKTGVARKVFAPNEQGPPAPDIVYARGPLSKNLWTQAFQRGADKLAETGFRLNATHGQNFDKLIRHAVNQHAVEHFRHQKAYKDAVQALAGKPGAKKRRAEVLLAYLSSGGHPVEELAMRERQALEAGTGSTEASQAAFLRDHVIPETRQLSAADHAFMDAARTLSQHTTGTHVGLGRFRAEAGLYRAHANRIAVLVDQADKIAHDYQLAHDLAPEQAYAGMFAPSLAKELGFTDQMNEALHIQRVLRPAVLAGVAHDAPMGARVIERGGKMKEAERARERAWKDHQAHVAVMNARPKPPERINDPKAARAKYAPGAYAAHRADMKAWRVKEKRASAKAQQSGKTWTDLEGRGKTLSAADLEQHRLVPDPVDTFNQYSDALKAFGKHHVEQGGVAPARVEYTKARLTKRAYRRGIGRHPLKANARSPRQQATTGKSFASGNYMIDATSPLRESVHAQRLRTGIGAYRVAVDQVGKHVPAGYTVGPNEVAVPVGNLASLAKAETKVEHVSGSDNYAAETSLRDQFAKRLELAPGRQAVTVEPSIILPKGTWDRVVAYTRPVSQSNYDRAMGQYQRWLISLFPGTTIGNTLGSVPLALFAGAGPRDFARAFETKGLGRLRQGDVELTPHSTLGAGASGGHLGPLDEAAGNPISYYMNMMRAASVYGEDVTRIAAYHHFARPFVKAEAKRLAKESEKFIGPRPGGKDVLTWRDTLDEAAREFARGNVNPKAYDHVLDQTEKFMGNMLKPYGKIGRELNRTHAVLFQNWVGHMLKLVLYTLPVKHPRRAVFLNTVAAYGDQYRQEHGVWPSWMTDFFPVIHEAAQLPGGAGLQKWTHAFSLMQINPQSTAGGTLQGLTSDRPGLERLAGTLAPPWGTGLTFLNQWRDNADLTPDQKLNLGRTLLNDVLGVIPGERKMFPQGGMRLDTLPWDPQAKTYVDPFTHQIQSPFLAPTTRPDQGLAGFLERAFGVGGYQVPNEGAITTEQAAGQAIRSLPQPGKDAAVARRAFQRKAAQPAAKKALSGP